MNSFSQKVTSKLETIMNTFKNVFIATFLLFILLTIPLKSQITISDETEECLICHTELHPGIVSQWEQGQHSKIIPLDALKKNTLQLKVSSKSIPDSLKGNVVGCYECHSLNSSKHPDSFEHNGYNIHTIVSPNDCAVCHEKEVDEYSENMMSHAYDILMKNPLYLQMVRSVNGITKFNDRKIEFNHPTKLTNEESCLYCHGTNVKVGGIETRDTDFGEYDFPILEGWPNQGVGRINPDGSKGSCTSCHSRHDFSIKMARNPATCSECHKGPDVPAYKVYQASKHGNIYSDQKNDWDMKAVPWTLGKDFTAPTCATCHVSLVVDEDENIIAERTHKFSDRLSWRLFGVPYSQAQPKSPKVHLAKNKDGLPLLSEMNGDPVEELLISKEEQQERNDRMKNICLSCHSTNWVENHFVRLENTIKETNELTKVGTELITKIWDDNLADRSNLFDESIERDWTSLWLFYTNSTKFSSAMGGGGDYGVFADGRYQGTETLMRMHDWYRAHKSLKINIK